MKNILVVLLFLVSVLFISECKAEVIALQWGEKYVYTTKDGKEVKILLTYILQDHCEVLYEIKGLGEADIFIKTSFPVYDGVIECRKLLDGEGRITRRALLFKNKWFLRKTKISR